MKTARDIRANVTVTIPGDLELYNDEGWRDELVRILTRALPEGSTITVISGSAILPGIPGRSPYDCYVEDDRFLDQSPDLPSPIVAKLLSVDRSPSYELDAAALYRLESGYCVIVVSGCSCWPDRGGTRVYSGASAEAAINSAADEGLSGPALRNQWLDGGRPS